MDYDPTIPERKSRLSDDDLNTAIAWLEANEGGDGESDHCQRVADWLKIELNNRAARRIAKETGATPGQVRDAIARKINAQHGNES